MTSETQGEPGCEPQASLAELAGWTSGSSEPESESSASARRTRGDDGSSPSGSPMLPSSMTSRRSPPGTSPSEAMGWAEGGTGGGNLHGRPVMPTLTVAGQSETTHRQQFVTASAALPRGESTSSAEDSPARTSASPGSEPASPAPGRASSMSSPESQLTLGHAGCSWRTSWDCSPLRTDGTSPSFFTRWPGSGMASLGGFSTLDSSEFPSGAVECSLSDILEASPGRRFELSARAASGILRRSAARGRELPPDLEAALRAMAG